MYTIWILFYVSVLCCNMKLEPIRTRNPAILLVNSVGALLIGNVQVLFAFSIPIPCYLLQSRIQLASLIFMPAVLRGIQYVLLINEDYRQRCPKFKSTKFLFYCNVVFAILHTAVCEVLSRVNGVYENDCIATWSFAYAMFVIISFIVALYKLYRLIPWSYDSFFIANDLKYCSLFWAIAGIALLVTKMLSEILDKPHLGSVLGSWINFLLFEAQTFFITVVRPVHKFVFNKFGCCAKGKAIRRVAVESQIPYIKSTSQSNLEEERKQDADILKANVQTLNRQLQVMNMVLESDEATKKLHGFCNRRLCAEISLFLEKAHDYKLSWLTDTDTESFIKSISIIDDFIHANATNSINISGKLRDTVLNSVKSPKGCFSQKPAQDFFDECYKEMCKLFFANLQNGGDCEFWLICVDHLEIDALRSSHWNGF